MKQLHKEQGDTEISVVELSLGQTISAAPKRKWIDLEAKLRAIVLNYEDYDTIN